MWAGPGASWLRKFLIWGATASISFGVLVLSGIPYGLGLGWTWAITGLPRPAITGYSPSGFLGQQMEFLGNALGLPGGTIADILRTAMKWGAVGLVLLLMFRGDHSRVVRRMALAFAAVVLLSPIIQPWYILWFVPFLAVTGIRDDWQMRCLYVGVTFFVVFGAQDQLSVWSFVEVLRGPASSWRSSLRCRSRSTCCSWISTPRTLLIHGRRAGLAKRAWQWLLARRTSLQRAGALRDSGWTGLTRVYPPPSSTVRCTDHQSSTTSRTFRVVRTAAMTGWAWISGV